MRDMRGGDIFGCGSLQLHRMCRRYRGDGRLGVMHRLRERVRAVRSFAWRLLAGTHTDDPYHNPRYFAAARSASCARCDAGTWSNAR